jgi:hypothetical protein
MADVFEGKILHRKMMIKNSKIHVFS